jgi:hypothetical protein
MNAGHLDPAADAADPDPDADPPMEISREEDEEDLHRRTADEVRLCAR